ncbi:hypothetical protein [Natronorubrum aibiense]|uniref:DUF8163 domain-containing protein n=1 Tax=Natronorubrum aibiense TaxID=348826 RepID=A0A5P9P2B1_9EURY|nr:hypothetical protein [Natronorubrum aibiense]QFU82258.1 hypothetical protein GCU68_06790 [Natronorubrum aibiense]
MSTAADEQSGRDWPTIGALAVLTAVLTLAAGPTGTVAALTTAVIWYTLGIPYAIAAGHVVLATAFSGDIDLFTFIDIELAFVFVLVLSSRATNSLSNVAVALVSAVGLVSIAWAGSQAQPLWLAASILLAVFALTAYTLHRYELVRLGLVPDEHTTDTKFET